jgi:ligand-binding sensor domain-containing protein
MKVCCILAFVLLSIAVVGQELAHFTITQQHGLPSNTVYDVFQDSQGFLWVATENGLARYNGSSFRRYTNTQVRSTAVSHLSEDNDSRIWLHNFFGEILYIENDTLKKLASWDDQFTQGFPSITNQGDSLLISNGGMLLYYSILSKTWHRPMPAASASINYNHHAVGPGNQVWVCSSTDSVTYVESIGSAHQQKYVLPHSRYKLNRNVVRLLTWQGSLWLFDQVSHLFLQLEKDTVMPAPPYYNAALQHARQVQNLGDSLLAFTGPNGVSILNRDNKWMHVLPGKNVSCLAADREGGLWAGTLNEGLLYIPIAHSFLFPRQASGLYTKLAVDKKNNRVFGGGYAGQVDVFSGEGKTIATLAAPVAKEVQSIFFDSTRNELYVFTNALRRYNANTLTLLETISVAATKDIAYMHPHVALATSAGLYLYHPDTHTKQVLPFSQRITALAFQQSSQTLWVGSQKGLYQYNTLTGKRTVWQPSATSDSPGTARLLVCGNRLLVGTLTNGLYVIDAEKITHISPSNGLSSDHITSLHYFGTKVWVGTDRGLSLVDTDDLSVTVLNETKGLLAEEVYDLSLVGNALWVSHANGLQIFEHVPTRNLAKPLLHINHISSNGQTLPLSSATLPDGSQQLSIVFDVSNNLRSRGTATILYRIKELGEDWHSTTLKNPVANYLSLPYGNFTLEARAKNEDGILSALLTLPIIVPTPFWKQLWFSAVTIFLLIAFTAFVVYKRLQKINETNRLRLHQLTQEQELRIAQLTSIRAQMNPHFIFNTMSLIQGKVLNGLTEDANRNIQNFSLLLRKVLDFSGKEMITLQQEIEILEKYLAIEKDRFDGLLSYSISLDERLQQELVRIPSLLTQPFVENALRHGLLHKEGAKKLSIEFTLANDCLTIRVDDNGVGRKTSAAFNKSRTHDHRSFAIAAYQKRIDLLNSNRSRKIELSIIDKYSEQGVASGTTVVILVPLDV